MSRSIRQPVVFAESPVGRRIGSLPFPTTAYPHPSEPHPPISREKPPAPEVRIRRYCSRRKLPYLGLTEFIPLVTPRRRHKHGNTVSLSYTRA